MEIKPALADFLSFVSMLTPGYGLSKCSCLEIYFLFIGNFSCLFLEYHVFKFLSFLSLLASFIA